MWIAKLQVIAATTLVIGTLSTGAGAMTHHVTLKEKETAEIRVAKDGQKLPADTVSTSIVSIDAVAGTVTAGIEGKKAPPATLKLAGHVPVALAGITKGAPATPGTLADVTAGTSVTLQLSKDRTTVTYILVNGDHLSGQIKAVDAGTHTVTVGITRKDKSGAVSLEKTLPLHPHARIAFAGSGKSKGDSAPQREATFADLTVDTPVLVSISADRKFITDVILEGRIIYGSVVTVDPGKGTIVVSSKGENGPIEETFSLAPGAALFIGEVKAKDTRAGTLDEVKVGMSADVQILPSDPTLVMSLYAWTPRVKGEK